MHNCNSEYITWQSPESNIIYLVEYCTNTEEIVEVYKDSIDTSIYLDSLSEWEIDDLVSAVKYCELSKEVLNH